MFSSQGEARMDADHCAHVAAFYQGQFDRLWSQYDEANFDALAFHLS